MGGHDSRAWVRRRRRERYYPDFFVERHIYRTLGFIVWDAIPYESRSPLIFMTARRYIQEIVNTYLLPYIKTLQALVYLDMHVRMLPGLQIFENVR